MSTHVAVAKDSSQAKGVVAARASRPRYFGGQVETAQREVFSLPKLSWSIGNIALDRPSQRNRPDFGGVQGTEGTQRARPLPWPIQAKLEIGAVDDPLEREAEQLSEKVMHRPNARGLAPPHANGVAVTGLLRKCACGGTCADCQKKKSAEKLEQLQTKRVSGSNGRQAHAPASVHGVLQSSGQPLDTATRAFMEPRFGHDFSQVRVHSTAAAQQSARDVNAQAYTVGRNIVFAAGRFAPGTHEGRRLIAHELVHVVQQNAAGASTIDAISSSAVDEPKLMRSVALDSTVSICNRVLQSRKIKITQGGLRVALLLRPQDTNVPQCGDHDFSVTLNRSNTVFDDEVASCSARTGGTRSFSYGNLSSGDYYLTISRTFDNPNCCMEGDILVFDEAISASSSGCVPHKSLSTMDIVHGALDIAGLIPVLGAIPDGVNAGIYAVEGDWVNAGISVGAMIPLVGDGVLLGKIGTKTALKFSEKAAVRLGEEGIAKALKVGREAGKVEKATVELGKDAAKVGEKAAVKDATTAVKEGTDAAKEAEVAAKEAKEAKEAAEAAAKKAAEDALKKKIAKCLEIYAAMKALGCKGCKGTDTKPERAAKIACLTAEIALREEYLRNGCDDILEDSIRRKGIGQDPEGGHKTQLAQKIAALANCATLPTK